MRWSRFAVRRRLYTVRKQSLLSGAKAVLLLRCSPITLIDEHNLAKTNPFYFLSFETARLCKIFARFSRRQFRVRNQKCSPLSRKQIAAQIAMHISTADFYTNRIKQQPLRSASGPSANPTKTKNRQHRQSYNMSSSTTTKTTKKVTAGTTTTTTTAAPKKTTKKAAAAAAMEQDGGAEMAAAPPTKKAAATATPKAGKTAAAPKAGKPATKKAAGAAGGAAAKKTGKAAAASNAAAGAKKATAKRAAPTGDKPAAGAKKAAGAAPKRKRTEAPEEEAAAADGGNAPVKKTRKPSIPKDESKPKGPQSAYILFANSVRDQIKTENPTMTMCDIAKEIGARWRALSNGEKAPFIKLAIKDKARHKKEFDAWTPDPAIAKAQRKARRQRAAIAKKNGAPKRAMSAYMFFSNTVRADWMAQNPDKKITDASIAIGEQWNQMSDEEKTPYLEQAEDAKAAYCQLKQQYDAMCAAQ